MMDNEKKQLRSELKARLRKLPDEQRRQEENAVLAALRKLPAWRDSLNLLVFLSMKNEFSTNRIFLEARHLSKKIWTPRLCGDTLRFHLLWSPEKKETGPEPEAFDPEDYPLDYNPYGIWEPSPDLPVFPGKREKTETSLVITPGLAFDREGNRLGRGKGFYDRWFSAVAGLINPSLVTAIGIGYSLQLVDEVPHGKKDIPLPLLILGGEVIYRP